MDDERATTMGYPTPPPRQSRLSAFSSGCGMAPDDLVTAVLRVQQINADRIRALATERQQPWRVYRDRGLADRADRDQNYLKALRDPRQT